MKYNRSQPFLTTSRSTERIWQCRQGRVICSKQANLNFIFFFFSIFFLYFAHRQITGFKRVPLLEPDFNLQAYAVSVCPCVMLCTSPKPRVPHPWAAAPTPPNQLLCFSNSIALLSIKKKNDYRKIAVIQSQQFIRNAYGKLPSLENFTAMWNSKA